MRISDWSSDVCSSELHTAAERNKGGQRHQTACCHRFVPADRQCAHDAIVERVERGRQIDPVQNAKLLIHRSSLQTFLSLYIRAEALHPSHQNIVPEYLRARPTSCVLEGQTRN